MDGCFVLFFGRVSYIGSPYRGLSRSPWKLRVGGSFRFFSAGFHRCDGVIAVYHAHREIASWRKDLFVYFQQGFIDVVALSRCITLTVKLRLGESRRMGF